MFSLGSWLDAGSGEKSPNRQIRRVSASGIRFHEGNIFLGGLCADTVEQTGKPLTGDSNLGTPSPETAIPWAAMGKDKHRPS